MANVGGNGMGAAAVGSQMRDFSDPGPARADRKWYQKFISTPEEKATVKRMHAERKDLLKATKKPKLAFIGLGGKRGSTTTSGTAATGTTVA